MIISFFLCIIRWFLLYTSMRVILSTIFVAFTIIYSYSLFLAVLSQAYIRCTESSKQRKTTIYVNTLATENHVNVVTTELLNKHRLIFSLTDREI